MKINITSEAAAASASETITSEAASETGRSVRTVRRVLDLMLEAEAYGATLTIIKGRLGVVHDDIDRPIPAWRQAEIQRHYDDCLDFLDPIGRSMVRISFGTSLQ
jgi:hypothetical protein